MIAAPASIAQGSRARRPDGARLTVLVIAADAAARDLLPRVVREDRLLVTDDLAEGLALAESDPPDVAFVEVGMGDGAGTHAGAPPQGRGPDGHGVRARLEGRARRGRERPSRSGGRRAHHAAGRGGRDPERAHRRQAEDGRQTRCARRPSEPSRAYARTAGWMGRVVDRSRRLRRAPRGGFAPRAGVDRGDRGLPPPRSTSPPRERPMGLRAGRGEPRARLDRRPRSAWRAEILDHARRRRFARHAARDPIVQGGPRAPPARCLPRRARALRGARLAAGATVLEERGPP